MPAFGHISKEERMVMIDYLLGKAEVAADKKEMEAETSMLYPRYYMNGYQKLNTKWIFRYQSAMGTFDGNRYEYR